MKKNKRGKKNKNKFSKKNIVIICICALILTALITVNFDDLILNFTGKTIASCSTDADCEKGYICDKNLNPPACVFKECIEFNTDTNKLNIGDYLTDVRNVALTNKDLVNLLANKTYLNAEGSEYNYEQKIKISDSVLFSHFADSSYKDNSPTLGVKLDKKDPVLNYTINFIKPPVDDTGTGDWEDFEDTLITLLGKEYLIVDAGNSTRAKLTLMGGAIKDSLTLNEEGTYVVDENSYTIKLSYVDSDECQFEINGQETQKLNKGEQGKAGGIDVGVSDIDYSTGAVTEIMKCDFFVGADKIVMEHSKEIEVNNIEIEGMTSWIEYSSSNEKVSLDKIIIAWKAGEDLFVTEDSSVEFPIFKSFKISSKSLITETEEEISVEGSDTVIELKVPIESGEANIELLASDGAGTFNKVGGDGGDEGFATSSGMLHYNLNEDQYFIATYISGAEASSYLVSVDCDSDGCDFTDEVDGSSLASDVTDQTSFDIGDASIKLEYFEEDNYVNLTTENSQSYFDRLVSEQGLLIHLPTSINAAQYTILMEEENKDGNIGSGDDLSIVVGHNSDNKVQVNSVTFENWAEDSSSPSYISDPGDSGMKIGYAASDLGTKVFYDTGPNQNTALLIYHGEQAWGRIYLGSTC